MPSLQAVRDSNSAYSPSYIPTIVVFGGTSGIGEAISKGFARYTKGRAHLIIVGRNKAAAEATIASLPKASSDADPTAKGSQYEFVSCDVTVMKNIHQLAEDLKTRLEKINYLILSAGVFGFGGREDTVDGLDTKLAARYYSRFAILQDFLPLLKAAKAKGEPASVLSVLGAGQTSAINFDDLGLNKKYSGIDAMVHSTTYNDLMVQVRAQSYHLFLPGIDQIASTSQGFAEREPDIAFTHIYPGFVDTGMLRPKGPIARVVMLLARPFIKAIATAPKDCAEYMIYAFLNADKGMYRRGKTGDDIGLRSFPAATEEQKKAFWEHSVGAVKGKA
ncbi:hypothetical protein EST38_g4381 [Candolleomyces aberdarensis]|uniref:NAD(P)-binding protein n=1 Tax=Candolleomyces aberdarensis TaxID=2316362 RepID=A0A4Q2DPZ2_9AGAR|nr:hypothetical protein EST38_g4381 [Candolleomyces aberdarensis]